MEPARRYYEVAPLAYTGTSGVFTYHFDGDITPGHIVTVPLGRRRSHGVVLRLSDRPAFKTRAIEAVVAAEPVPGYLIELAAWLEQYYAASPSSIWTTILPTGVAKKRRADKAVAEDVSSDAGPNDLNETLGSADAPLDTAADARTRTASDLVAAGLADARPASNLPSEPLADEQAAALAHVRARPDGVTLVQGVTGSGKTRVYLELAAETLAAGRSVIVLVPEITLTPQVVGQFEAAFGRAVISTHSKLTEAQRHKSWSAASANTAAGQPSVVVGPRSSLFLPLHDIGLIVVDESHETSYKQSQHPRYHAVTVAARLAAIVGARAVLGSATPSLGELYLAEAGRIRRVRMSTRANAITPAAAIVLDLRDKDELKQSKLITRTLHAAITETLEAGRQSLLYLNRRGSASQQLCGSCGHVATCPNCLLPLTFHADWLRLVCHHCNFRRVSEAVCPACGMADMKLLGGGTKRVEAEVERLWPEARIARLDRDSATLAHIKQVMTGLRKGELDIVIGTQMIAKGLDLPRIDTVGVVSADTMLHVPDYTAAERTFQLLSQVAGRAGRGDRAGRVFIQTHTPDHPAIRAAATGDYDGFASGELEQRRLMGYPPHRYLLKLSVSGATREAAIAAGEAFASGLRRYEALKVTGPAPAFIETQGGRYHWVLTVAATRRPALVSIVAQLPSDDWSADLDPIDLM